MKTVIKLLSALALMLIAAALNSEDWEKMKDSDIKPKSFGADVTGARRLVSTTNVYDHWTTEHTCYDCKYKWTINHSKLVNTISRTIEKRWYESN